MGGGLVSQDSFDQLVHSSTIESARSTGDSGVWMVSPAVASDSELLQRCRKGDAEAWEILVGRYERLVFSVALRNGVSWEDAADVTQTTFIALLDAIDLLREDQRLGSWLMTVARRQAWRSRRRGERMTGPLDRSSAPADAIEDWERLVWLHAGLEQLGDPCRELLTALYLDVDSPSYAAIAPRLNRAVGSIGPLRARCLARLRAILGEAA
jgi:RNA polymerase sigma factor (sigma-70 family)